MLVCSSSPNLSTDLLRFCKRKDKLSMLDCLKNSVSHYWLPVATSIVSRSTGLSSDLAPLESSSSA